jgi:hypothetical protein
MFLLKKTAPRRGKLKSFAPGGVGDLVAQAGMTKSFFAAFFSKTADSCLLFAKC